MNTGLDPELLTIYKDTVVPASYFLDAPERDANGKLNSISFDNAAVEIRPEPSGVLDTLVSNTGRLMHEARARMRLARRRRQIPSESRLSLIPAAALFPTARFIKSVRTFGCSPSQTILDDYGVSTTKTLCDPDDTPFRSAGFHIHQELSHPDTEQPAVAILDGLLGLTDVLMNDKLGWLRASKIRRFILGYGRAGEHRARTVSSGCRVLEYRVMSPWPLLDAKHILWATSTVKSVCENPIDTLLNVLDHYPDRAHIIEAVNNNDPVLAKQLQYTCRAAWYTLGDDRAHS